MLFACQLGATIRKSFTKYMYQHQVEIFFIYFDYFPTFSYFIHLLLNFILFIVFKIKILSISVDFRLICPANLLWEHNNCSNIYGGTHESLYVKKKKKFPNINQLPSWSKTFSSLINANWTFSSVAEKYDVKTKKS